MTFAIDVVETAYRFDLSFPDWLDELSRGIRDLKAPSEGIVAWEFDAGNPAQPAKIGVTRAAGDVSWLSGGLLPIHQRLRDEDLRPFLRVGTHCSTIWRRIEEEQLPIRPGHPFAKARREVGFFDIWEVCSVNPDGTGLFFAIPLMRQQEFDRREAALWRQVGVHIAAGYRLRRGVRDRIGPDDAAAVFAPNGRCEYASYETRRRDNLEALTRGVNAIERSRSPRSRRQPAAALRLWQGLVRGQWSLVEIVESDGKRYIMAVENSPPVHDTRTLTKREAQIATYAAQGQSNKLIAYELGLKISTVATHLQNALRKLRVRSRTELVWIYEALGGGLRQHLPVSE